MQKTSGNNKGGRKPPVMLVPWGRGASEYRPGLFTKQYFENYGEACAADIYYGLSEEIERLNSERVEIGEKPFRRPNYSSFSRYMHRFTILGLIERTDRREPAIYRFLQETWLRSRPGRTLYVQRIRSFINLKAPLNVDRGAR
jgi:hypothetical protein